jgi:hypothetical protein
MLVTAKVFGRGPAWLAGGIALLLIITLWIALPLLVTEGSHGTGRMAGGEQG